MASSNERPHQTTQDPREQSGLDESQLRLFTETAAADDNVHPQGDFDRTPLEDVVSHTTPDGRPILEAPDSLATEPGHWNARFSEPAVVPPEEHRDSKTLTKPRVSRGKRLVATAVAALTLGGGAFVVKGLSNDGENQPPDTSDLSGLATPQNEDNSSSITSGQSGNSSQATPESLEAEARTPELPISDDPQELIDQLFTNYNNAVNFSLSDPEFSSRSLDLYLPASVTGNYATSVRESISDMPEYLSNNPDYTENQTGVVLESDFTNPDIRHLLVDVTAQLGDYGTEHNTVRFTLEEFSVEVDTGNLQKEIVDVWLITHKDTVEPGEIE